MIQTAILILSGLAFWLSTSATPHRAGYAIGVIAQPLWIYETWQASQWGMFLLSLCFFVGYARALWRARKPRPAAPLQFITTSGSVDWLHNDAKGRRYWPIDRNRCDDEGRN